MLQNTADFFNFSFCGVVRPRDIDWMSTYNIRDFTGPQHKKFDVWRERESTDAMIDVVMAP